MIKNILTIGLVFITASCSSIKFAHVSSSKPSNTQKVKADNVDLNLNQPSKENAIEIKPQEETVRIGERGGDVYTSQNSDENSAGEVKKIKIGLSLGPGLYRTINYVSILKILERQNHAPDIISGTGFGAIVAAMYASGMTPEVIEWNFYKYFKDKKRNRPYDVDWVAEIDSRFLSKFKTINIQDTKKKFFITLYDHNTKKTFYFDKGNIRDLLLLNLRLSNNFMTSKSGQKYSAAFEKEVFNARLLRQLGADFTIAVDVLGSRFDFDNTNEFLLGVYNRVAGRIAHEKRDYDFSLSLPLTGMNLDSTKDNSSFLQKTYEFMQKQSPILQSKINVKIESLSHLGN